MHKIQMVDLYNQYVSIKDEIDLSIKEVIDSTEFVKGSKVKEFEQNLCKYLDVKNAIACGNGTDALQIALMALNLQPGDEILTTPFTFIATVEVIALLNLKPVFVDVDPTTFNIDVSKIEQHITAKTKVILPVHLFGQPVDMDKIIEIASKYSLFVIEDAAQAIGANYFTLKSVSKKICSIGHISCTSFFPSKNLGCFGDGGAIFSNNDELSTRIRVIANHGMKQRYYHDEIGVNSRLDTIQAAVLNVKLKYLDSYITKRKNAAEIYNLQLSPIKEVQTPISIFDHVFHQYTLIVKDGERDKLKQYLEQAGIPTMVYYPVPLHLQKAFAFLGYKKGDFPITENLSESVLSLPMHTELSIEQQTFICDTIRKFYN